MPEKPLSIATYAAGASLAAITLVYVFGPTFFLDDDAANSSKTSRKRSVVGLVNLANDCFINSVLQALAGLPDLRLYLIRELHQRSLDGPEVYSQVELAFDERTRQQKVDAPGKENNETGGIKLPRWKQLGLQQGLVTQGLKQVLDALNERPIYKKTISAQGFIRCVEESFRTRISRQQQDAQEFLQVVTERLYDEWKAGMVVRRGLKNMEAARQNDATSISDDAERQEDVQTHATVEAGEGFSNNAPQDADGKSEFENTDFPLEGKLEATVECMHCHFKPKPSVSAFTTLTLHVPHYQSTTSLNECFDGLLKVEKIEDFKCDRCRLVHALDTNNRQLSRQGKSLSTDERSKLESDIAKINHAIETDPESPPDDVQLPEKSTAPRRNIERHTRISRFPRLLAIHLSRSMWSQFSTSTKNLAKVSFPEKLPLGGLLDRKTYRLLCVVTHKGGHSSGHYESFRRQVLKEPFSTSATLGTEGIYSHRGTPVSSPRTSITHSPGLSARTRRSATLVNASNKTSNDKTEDTSPNASEASESSVSLHKSNTATTATSVSLAEHQPPHRMQHTPGVPFDAMPTPGLPTLPQTSSRNEAEAFGKHTTKRSSSVTTAMHRLSTSGVASKGKRWAHRKGDDRWWRISDDSIKEAKTSDVLKMQREVYLLFYEIIE
ncbi:cysteine proteinase [Polychaeton citri CBS 116435]|uniref:Ubiquitin carboxyl-terminal hydrolase n=1 Tax=Polychaeton citri CBS 116435 TaxID=1314669 RepID=A0A9P4QAX2_9PEZI|nr:cysteine proteinase [Polychaeton citri CBS 116435]